MDKLLVIGSVMYKVKIDGGWSEIVEAFMYYGKTRADAEFEQKERIKKENPGAWDIKTSSSVVQEHGINSLKNYLNQ